MCEHICCRFERIANSSAMLLTLIESTTTLSKVVISRRKGLISASMALLLIRAHSQSTRRVEIFAAFVGDAPLSVYAVFQCLFSRQK